MIGKLKGTVDTVEEDCVTLDVHGVGYVAFCGARTLAACRARGGGFALHRDLCARGHDPPLRLRVRRRARLVSSLQSVQGWAPRWRSPSSARCRRGPRQRHRAAGPHDGRPRAGRRAEGRRAHRRRLKDKAPAFSGAAAVEASASSATSARAWHRRRSPTPCRRWSISAIRASRRPARWQRRVKEAGEDAPSTTLIRLGLKALSR